MRAAGLAVCAAAMAAVLTGCGPASTTSNNNAVTITGSTLTLYAAQPPGVPSSAATDVLDAERMAISQEGTKIGSYTVRFVLLHGAEVSDDARAAVSDQSAVAYLGEIDPGASGVSVQINNELGLLQVSPTDTASYLTRASAAVSGSPGHFYPANSTFKKTFARVVPTTVSEAAVLVKAMRARQLNRLYIADDGSDYGAAIAASVRADAKTAGLTVQSSAAGADAVFYGGTPGTAAKSALDAAAAASPSATLFAPSALYDNTFVAQLSAAAQRSLVVSSPGWLTANLPSSGRTFASDFARQYGHVPAPQAIFGFAAVQAIFQALREAGDHVDQRGTVVTDIRSLHVSATQSVLGAYTIDSGDTNLAPFVLATPKDGALVPRTQG